MYYNSSQIIPGFQDKVFIFTEYALECFLLLTISMTVCSILETLSFSVGFGISATIRTHHGIQCLISAEF